MEYERHTMAGVDSGRTSATTETNLLALSVGSEAIEERPLEGRFAGPADEGDVGTAALTRCARAVLGEGRLSTDLCCGVVGAGDAVELQAADELDALLGSLAMQRGSLIVGPGTIEREGVLSGTLSTSGPESHLMEGYSWADSEAVPIADLHDGGQCLDFSSMPEMLTIVGGPYPQENYVRCPHAIPIVLCSNPPVSSNE